MKMNKIQFLNAIHKEKCKMFCGKFIMFVLSLIELTIIYKSCQTNKEVCNIPNLSHS